MYAECVIAACLPYVQAYAFILSIVLRFSILGPLLFILYVNDFRNCLDFSTNVSFADDTNIFITGKNIQSVYSKTNLELKNIDEWMTANKLTVNSAKIKYLLFTPRKSNYRVGQKNVTTFYILTIFKITKIFVSFSEISTTKH